MIDSNAASVTYRIRVDSYQPVTIFGVEPIYVGAGVVIAIVAVLGAGLFYWRRRERSTEVFVPIE